MNILDLIAIGVLGLSGLMAFSRGFGKEVLSLAGWIAAALLTFHVLYPLALPVAHRYIGIDIVAEIIAAVGPFLVALFACTIFSTWIRAMVRPQAQQAGLGPLNRSLGFLFGLLRGAVILSIFYLLLVSFLPKPEERPSFINEARTLPMMERGATLVRALLPAQFAKIGEQAIDGAAQTIETGKTLNNAYQILHAPAPPSPDTEPGPIAAPVQAPPLAAPAQSVQAPPPTPVEAAPPAPAVPAVASPVKAPAAAPIGQPASAAPVKQPEAAPATNKAPTAGYKASERKGLDRLIQGTDQ
ncbi:MAG TPA: CvpA family protein [Dongiaceae bacterium]|jgi:membrane protein required for colicin V production|nr:CvpA family protein [Dongiaceae bacterium]